MATSFENIIGSQPVKFVLGIDEQKVWAHPFLIATHSKPLSHAVEKAAKHSKFGKDVSLPDTDGSTFVRFVEYLYKGWYTAAEHGLVEDIEAKSETEVGLNTPSSTVFAPQAKIHGFSNAWAKIDWGDGASQTEKDVGRDDLTSGFPMDDEGYSVFAQATAKKTKKKKFKPAIKELAQPPPPPPPPPPLLTTEAELIEAFKTNAYDEPYTFPVQPSIRPNKDASEVYKDVFLSHAKVYLFAAQYQVRKLRLLALQNLHETLVHFTLHPERAGDVSALLEYLYSDCVLGLDHFDLGTMVLDYVVCHIDVMHKDETFKRLIRGDSSIAVDLMSEVVRRLN